MTPSADVVVIGGGIVGAACAYSLALAGANVRVLERHYPAAGTSHACDGLILCCDKAAQPELELARASAGLWAELPQKLGSDFHYTGAGAIVLAESEESLAEAHDQAQRMGRAGVPNEMLDVRALQELEPNLARDLAGGVYYTGEAQVDSRLATVALLQEAQRLGAQVHLGTEVQGVEKGPGDRVVGVATADAVFSTGALVCAAGVWSPEIAALAGVHVPVRPRKGHILVTGRAPDLIRHPLLEGSYASTVHSADESVQVAFVAEMTAAGTLLLGSSREFAGPDFDVSPAVMRAVAARALRFLPPLAQVAIIRAFCGLRPWSPDHLPFVGPVAAVPGFYLATGHEGAGIGLAPITGELIAGWIVGSAQPAYATAVLPDRFNQLN